MDQRAYDDLVNGTLDVPPPPEDFCYPDEPFTEELPFEEQEQDFNTLMVKSIQPSKQNVSLLAYKIQQQVMDGKVNAIEAAIALNATKQMCEEALNLIRPEVVGELDKSGGKVSQHDCKVERAEVGTKYCYDCNPEWVEFKAMEDHIANDRKKLEERLKKISPGKLLVDEDTGETLTGPTKTSTTSFKVTLAK